MPETPRPLCILYRDDALVAVDKPPGLLVHRSAYGRGDAAFALQMTRDAIGRRVYPVHRLDRPTSGVLVFGLTSAVAGMLAEQFRGRSVDKRYLAVVRGHAPEGGCIDSELVEKDGRGQKLDRPPRPAVTDYRTLGRVELPHPVSRFPTARFSLVEARPRTGRMHQIRRHLRRIGHPVVGDVRHGDRHQNRFFRVHLDCHRLLLAAVEIAFEHPGTGERLAIRAPLTGDFRRVVEALGWGQAAESALAGR